MHWFVFATMAAMAAGFVLLALARPVRGGEDAGPAARKAALKAQLREADRDRAQDRLNAHEHSLVRAEIARQLFRLEDEAPRDRGGTPWAKPILLAACAAMPVLAGGLYLATGSPGVAAQPFADRTDLPALVARAERQLRITPDDSRGWLALAPVYRRLSRHADAAKAYGMALQTGQFAPARRSMLLTEWSESEAAAGEPISGVRDRLAEAVELDPDNVKARFLLAAATEEAEEPEIALGAWKELLDRYPNATEGWVEVAKERLARLEVAASMPKEERGVRIEGMVAGLAERLERQPDDLEGWTRLIRSYAVLGRAGAARSAYERARGQFAGRAEALARLSGEAARSGIAIE